MKMAKMDMRMGAPAMKLNPSKEKPQRMMENWGMQMKEDDHSQMTSPDSEPNMNSMDTSIQSMNHASMDHSMSQDKMKNKGMYMASSNAKMSGMDMFSEYNYDYLKAKEKTGFDTDKPVNEVLLNLTGNMWRYIWSMNGVPLSEADKIKIETEKVTRITLNNLTMMHHPMHLHGHFFRVINTNGEYSPLKHTVNVPPMQQVVIEFDGTETGDWFFHCHVLYHMAGGMARVFSYGTPRDPRLTPFSLKNLTQEANHLYNWGTLTAASNSTSLNLMSSNTRNQFNLDADIGYNQNMELEFSYERYIYDYFRVFMGVNSENKVSKDWAELSTTAVGGIRFLTPYMFNLDVRMDSKLRPELRISREIMIFPKTSIFGNYEYQMDFGWVNELPEAENGSPSNYQAETTWSAGVNYMLSRNFSLTGSYDNRFGGGGGLTVRF